MERWKGKAARKIKNRISEAVGAGISLLVIVPFLLVAVNSAKSHAEANRLNISLASVTLSQLAENYKTVFEEADLLKSYANSLLVTVCSVVLIVVCSVMAAFVVVRRRDRPMRILNNFIIGGLTLPLAMIPAYFILSKLGMTGGNGAFLGAILIYGAGNFAFAYFLYTGAVKGIPREIDEAAIMDGANPMILLFRILFPMLKPMTITVVISEAMTVWNDFTVALYLLNTNSRKTAVLSTYMYSGAKSSEWNLLFADVVLVSFPVLILFFALQKYMICGLTAGAVKG